MIHQISLDTGSVTDLMPLDIPSSFCWYFLLMFLNKFLINAMQMFDESLTETNIDDMLIYLQKTPLQQSNVDYLKSKSSRISNQPNKYLLILKKPS